MVGGRVFRRMSVCATRGHRGSDVSPGSAGAGPDEAFTLESEVPRRGPVTNVRLTRKQGQLVAYVYCYTKVHRIPPSENEIAEFLGVYGPSAHQMILRLEVAGALARTPGQPRSIRIRLPRPEIPDLE